MKKTLLLALLFGSSSMAMSSTECYESAELKAGDWLSTMEDGVVTTIGESGQCVSFISHEGDLKHVGKVFIPFGDLYKAYSDAIEMGTDGTEKVMWLHKNTKASPKSINDWAQMTGLTPPFGWSANDRIESLLQGEQWAIDNSYEYRVMDAANLHVDPTFSLQRIYGAMGGEVYNACDEITTSGGEVSEKVVTAMHLLSKERPIKQVSKERGINIYVPGGCS